MLNHVGNEDAHPSPPVSADPPATTGEDSTAPSVKDGLAAATPVPMEPRYIRLPDALYNLRHRYPTVTESVFLECTRCHQWVAVPVLRDVPGEVAVDAVAASAQGLAPIEQRTAAHGPLQHMNQDTLHRRERLSMEATTAATHWRSARLLEKERQHTAPLDTAATHDGDRNGSSSGDASSSATASQQGAFQRILEQLRRGHRRATTTTPATTTSPKEEAVATTATPRHPLLYIPNPDTFVCAGWQCAWDADAMADLRREWMDNIYAALPMPAVTEAALTSSSSAASSSSPSTASFPASPALSQQERKAALNEALAEELRINHHRRPGRGCAGRYARGSGSGVDYDSGEGDALPPLSLPTPPTSTPSQAEATTATTMTSTMDGDAQLSRMQQAWVRAAALRLLRNDGSGSAEDVAEAERPRRPGRPSSPTAPSATAEETHGPLLSAYCWCVCDACGKLRRVAQPFPGGAPFVCAMAVTTSSSCRAVHNAEAAGSADGAAVVENACAVSEVEGLIQCGVRLCEAELIAAALSSPFLPYPLKSQLTSLSTTGGENGRSGGWRAAETVTTSERLSRADVARVLLAEPLLRTIQSSVAEAVTDGTGTNLTSPARRTPTSKGRRTATSSKRTTRDDDDAAAADVPVFLQRCLPVLRELARTMKKRGVTSLARQIQLTPSQIQAKREAVLRSSFLDSHHPSGSNISNNNANDRSTPSPASAESESKSDQPEQPQPQQQQRGEAEAEPKRETTASGSTANLPRARTVPTIITAVGGDDCVDPRATATSASAATTKTTTSSAGRTKVTTVVARGRGRSPLVAMDVPPSAPRKRGRPPLHRTAPLAAAPPTSATQSAAATRTKTEKVDDDGGGSGGGGGDGSTTERKRRRGALPRHEDSAVTSRSENVEPAETPPRRKVGRPRGRPRLVRNEEVKTENEAAASEEAEAVDTWEVVHWVQCDRCSKWRIVPHRVPPRIKFWECKMRYDAERGRATTCDDPDDADLSV